MIGTTISHYRILEKLGAGGMGVVYRAEDTRLGRSVALKFLLPQTTLDTGANARFLREARSAAALDHPNLCTIHEVGESEDGHLFLAMALYPGETLTARKPFVGDNQLAIAHAILHDEPVPPATLRVEVPAAMDHVVLTLLQKDPAKRYATVDELIADLASVETVGESAVRGVRTRR